MPVTITGSKYSGSLTSVSTITVNNSGAAFASGDFGTQRIIGLWNSTGTLYKGAAWVRRWVSATQIELETAFIDKNGNAVTQVVGDTYQISKNFADSVATGLAVSADQVTITDGLIFGTSGSGNSVCFYDENKQISAATTNLLVFDFRGGLSVFGHLSNYANRTFINPCNISISTNGDVNDQIKITNASAKFWWLGGTILTPSTARLIGGNSSSVSGLGTPGEWLKLWNLNTGANVMSPSDGGNWSSNAIDQQVINLKSFVTGVSVGLRWANGYVEGGTFYLSGGSSLSVFGSDSAGSFAIAALPGQYIIVQDCGTGTINPNLWRSSSAASQTINYTNLVTPKRGHIQDVSFGPYVGAANPNATGIFSFSGLFTGLINTSLALVKNNGILSTVQNSLLAASNKATLIIEEARVTGTTETVTENAWACGFYLYGYTLVSQSFATSTQTVNGEQAAKTVIFGGFIGQIIDTNISQSLASTVAAYTVLNTFDQLYDYAQYHKALNTTNAIYPNVSTQLINSAAGSLSTLIAHNLIIDSAAVSAFSINPSTQSITIKPTAFISSGIKADTFILSPGKTLTFVQGGNKSSAIYSVPATGIILVPPEAVNLTRSIFESGATINRIGSTGTAIVNVDAAQLANITAGVGVTIQVPQASIRFFGIPNVANAIISVQDLTSLVITYPAIVAGEVTVTVNTARSYKIRADAPGYLASKFFTIAGTTPEFQFNLADYRTLYLSGVNRASQISFNPTTFVITITDLTLSLSFADVFRTIEDYLASQQGLAYTAHPFPIVLPSKNLLWFPFDTTANAVNPARIKPATTNIADPELLFETYLEGALDTTYGLFDFTSAGGRIIRIRSEVAIAQVSGDGSFTISDRAKLEEIKTNTSGSDFVIL